MNRAGAKEGDMWENIEAERERAKLSRRELCDALGVTTRTYWNYLNGGAIPSDKLIAMSRLFNCTTDYLLGLSENRAGA